MPFDMSQVVKIASSDWTPRLGISLETARE